MVAGEGYRQERSSASIKSIKILIRSPTATVFCSAGLHGRQWPGMHAKRRINPSATTMCHRTSSVRNKIVVEDNIKTVLVP